MRYIISLGGSVIVPEEIDIEFLKQFKAFIEEKIEGGDCFAIITGGGKTCRKYQEAAKDMGISQDSDLDWIGIAASKLNAELLLRLFGDSAYEKIINDPFEKIETDQKLIIGAGFKPGSSTDLRAVQIGYNLGAKSVINISNIDYVYDKDPKKHPDAKRFEHMKWRDFLELFDAEWKPGFHAPFDPVAARFALEKEIKVTIIDKDLNKLSDTIEGKVCRRTVIEP